ncbi:MAG: hypothetical protein HYV41_02835 [Candidatus Magasanikbacteria bacterium]|nr:hypothetical protein [Candidatus Magasanikbacteria bacterium]
MTIFTAKIISKKWLSSDVFELHIERPDHFVFRAGQFVQFQIPDGEKTIWRSYSIASNTHDTHIELCLKFLSEGKGSRYFNALKVGDPVSFKEPQGKFVCSNDVQAYYFVATGVGIAPIMSMIREELEVKKSEKEIQLLFGVRSEDDVFWVDRLEELKRRYPLFNYMITLSQPKPNGGWTGLRGRVTEHILHHLVSHSFYVCGNAEMVKDVREILIKNGVATKQIHFEIF